MSGFWRAREPLVLASRSEIRRTLLENAGIPVEVVPADIDERGIESEAKVRDPTEAAMLLACEKAAAISRRMPGRWVLGADQTLALGARRLSKPADRQAAAAQLTALRGRSHSLHAAAALVQNGETKFAHVDSATLTMRHFPDAFLDLYLTAVGDAACSSVGGYQLEGRGVLLFDRIEGDHFTILGLPLLPLLAGLRELGLML
jgi:septum formation protein